MNKKVYGFLAAAALATVCLCGTSFAAGMAKMAPEESGGPGVAAKERLSAPVQDGVIIPENLKAASLADQLVVVVGTGGCNADVSYYKKDSAGNWTLAWTEAGIMGRNGITQQKREGDGKTPAGTYRFTMPFGLKEDPGAVLPYHRIIQGDFWVDDPQSAHYNRLVNTAGTAKDWNSAENLAAAYPVYNYALALSYNEECVPGMGSAIFLHCFTANPDNGSAGCIRLPEERAKELVMSVTDQSRIVIAQDLSQLQ